MSDERFKKIIAVFIALITLLAALTAYLQSDAAMRDDRANRDTKRYATEALGRKISGDARVNYDYFRAYQAWFELDVLADSAEKRGDTTAAKRYQTLRDRMARLSPLLAAPYFDAKSGQANFAKYEADVYLVEVTTLTEKFTAATAVKEAWDLKANTYIIQLTLLAVALFLFGLSATIASPRTRWIFATMGVAMTLVAMGWAYTVWTKPVPDLRESKGAIDAYAQGVGLAHQQLWKESVTEFDKALQAAPDYANVFAARASSKYELKDYIAAVADYEQARAAGDTTANTAGNLAWTYYLLGRFDDAVKMCRTALQVAPDELWIQYGLGVSLLAAGQVDAAKKEYADGMALAAKQVADAKAAGKEPPSYLWWGLDVSAVDLANLVERLDTGKGEGAPPRDKLAQPDVVRPLAQDLAQQLKSLAVALEYTGKPPAGALTAKIGAFNFAKPLYDEQGDVKDYQEAQSFEQGTNQVAVIFDYAGMKNGDDVLFKVYVNGEEDPSWRLIAKWELGANGAAEKIISPGYSETFVLSAGDYDVEIYVNSQFAQRGSFSVE